MAAHLDSGVIVTIANAREYIAMYDGDVARAVSGVLGTVERILSAIEQEN